MPVTGRGFLNVQFFLLTGLGLGWVNPAGLDPLPALPPASPTLVLGPKIHGGAPRHRERGDGRIQSVVCGGLKKKIQRSKQEEPNHFSTCLYYLH